MALVEIEAGPFLVTAAITGDSVRELGLAPAVPRDSKITGLGALERPGVSVAVGAPTVPVGSYAAKALALAWGRALG